MQPEQKINYENRIHEKSVLFCQISQDNGEYWRVKCINK